MDMQRPDMEKPYRADRVDTVKESYKSTTSKAERDRVEAVKARANSTPVHWVCMVAGTIIMLIGLAGFVAPNLFGMQLTWAHDLVHIIAGAAALYYGMNATVSATRNFSYILGGIFAVLGAAGFIFGVNTNLAVPVASYDSFWWSLSAGNLMFGTPDHIMHLVYGAVFIIGAALTSKKYDLLPQRGTTWH